MSEIVHKTQPIEHWIVDGKAYRMATEADVGKEVCFDDRSFENAMRDVLLDTLVKFRLGSDHPFIGHVAWKYAYVQDDSLLTPKRTPIPALGEGWFLLGDDEVLQKGDRISGSGIDAHGVTWLETGCVGMNVGMWRGGIEAHCCARYFGPTEETEIEPGPTEEPAKPIDWTKPVRTKDGRTVRIICTDGPGNYPVVGFVGARTKLYKWTLDGNWLVGDVHNNDLENAPLRIQREYWVNVYESHDTLCAYTSKHEADQFANDNRFACVKITIDCEEGEGL